jgi:O-antigen/teichoic acid export membrane protein
MKKIFLFFCVTMQILSLIIIVLNVSDIITNKHIVAAAYFVSALLTLLIVLTRYTSFKKKNTSYLTHIIFVRVGLICIALIVLGLFIMHYFFSIAINEHADVIFLISFLIIFLTLFFVKFINTKRTNKQTNLQN